VVLKVQKLTNSKPPPPADPKPEDKAASQEAAHRLRHAVQQVPFGSIAGVYQRKHQLQPRGLEFFHTNGSNFLLVFPSEAHRNQVYSKVQPKTKGRPDLVSYRLR
jgi:hypothetical protein